MKISKLEWMVIVCLVTISLVPALGGLIRLVELGLNIELFQQNPRAIESPLPVVIHIVSSALFCLIGAFQFLPSVRNQFPNWHKYAGYILFVAGVLSALTGLWMTHYFSFPASLQGELLYVTRLLVGCGMAASLIAGVIMAMRKHIHSHRAWMIRAYALGQGAGTQVLVSIPWFIAVGEPSGVSRDIMMLVAWLINMALAEGVILQTSRRFNYAL